MSTKNGLYENWNREVLMGANAYYPLVIYYDGNCRICDHEMAGLRRKNPKQRLAFIDISAPDFRPETHGRTMVQFMAQMHVKDATGRFYTGVDAFIEIRRAFPARSFAYIIGRCLALPVVYPLSKVGYALFARYRHLLPKHRNRCDTTSC